MTRTPRAAALLSAALAGAGVFAMPASASVVVSFAAAPVALPGVHVVARYDHVGVVVVRGSRATLARVARTPGVSGVATDVAMSPNSAGGTDSGSVFAWQAIGGAAGTAGAGAGVRVALVDTGVSDTAALSRSSGRLVDVANTSTDPRPYDGYGHGTFMAGIVAGGAVAGTGDHTLGVAPGATLLNVKVADKKGRTSLSRAIAGLDWVAAHASSVDVASFAFSADRPGEEYGGDPLTDAVERVRDAGVTIVVSAGNEPGEVSDPGFDPKAFTVGAADTRTSSTTVASFSGSGVVAGLVKPDVVGSGVGVLSVLPQDSMVARENPDAQRTDLLWRGSGTSESTAQAAGAAALFLQRFPGARPVDVKASLRAGASPLSDPRAGAGLVRSTTTFVSGTDEGGLPSADSGEAEFDGNSWLANSWSANSWSANSWSARAWAANSWSARAWAANSWSANSWSANSWSANSWSANSWSSQGGG